MSTAATAVDLAVQRRKASAADTPKITWREGFRPPRGVSAEEAKAAIDALPEPSPEHLKQASRRKKHVFHQELWGEDDAVYADRWRDERCRHIIASVAEIVPIGGRTVEMRVYECVPVRGKSQWFVTEQIKEDVDLRDGLMAQILRLQDQAAAKLEKVRDLLREE